MRHAAPADTASSQQAASNQQAADGLPSWDLSDLYPGPDSPSVDADFAWAEQAARAFAVAYQGKLEIGRAHV